MVLFQVIKANIDYLNNHYSNNDYIWSNDYRRSLNHLKNFIVGYYGDDIANFSEAEKELFDIFKEMLNKKCEKLLSKNCGLTGLTVVEDLTKMLQSIELHAKRLGIYEPPAPVPKQATKKAESAPVVVDGAASGEKKQLSERDKKILESIKTIETMLNDLKSLIL